jgi:hypothetical protein
MFLFHLGLCFQLSENADIMEKSNSFFTRGFIHLLTHSAPVEQIL